MNDGAPESAFLQHVKEFNKEMYFLYRGLISFKCIMEHELPEKARISKYFELMEKDGSSKQNERKDQAYDILMTLSSRKEPFTMGELSTAIGVSLSTSTRLVSRLVESDFIARLSDPDDRRLVRIALTENGRNFLNQLEEYIASRTSCVLKQFTEEERILLILLLRKLTKNLPGQKSLCDKNGDSYHYLQS